MRLLTLARYWNIVNYFYPYKYLADSEWQDVLGAFVPKFMAAKDVKVYHLTLLELFATINDSHAGFNPLLYTSRYRIPPFRYKIVEDKIVILEPYNDSICQAHDIRFGDVVLKINGQSIKSMPNTTPCN